VAPAGEAATAVTVNGITLTTPQPVTPTAGQRFKFADQPVTLTLKNAASTGSTPLTYGFQVANDANFTSVAFAKDGVAEGSGGQTSLKIDKLAGNKDYYWRVRAASGGSTGPYSTARAFNIGPEVVIQAPTIASPTNGGTMNGFGTLVVNNAAKSGPAGTLTYVFVLSDSSSFGSVIFNAAVAEGSGQTSATITSSTRLVANATYFWHVQATDPSSGVTGPFSSTASFKYVPFDMKSATIVNSPQDLGNWDESAKITTINFSPSAFEVDFDRRDGPNRWPDMIPAGFAGPLQYTLGMCAQSQGTSGPWFCSGVVQFWYGRELSASAPPYAVGYEWFYDPGRWGPLYLHQPADGELVGLFVASGNLRDGNNLNRATCPAVCERSNVALVPWTTGFASYTYATAVKALATVKR